MKTQRYLNRQQKGDMVRLSACITDGDSSLARWKEYDMLTKDEAKWWKTGLTMLNKVMTSIVQRQEPEQMVGLMRAADRMRVECIEKDSYTAYQNRIAREEHKGMMLVSQEAFEELAEKALVNFCSPCEKTGEEREKCGMRACFICLGLPMYSLDPPKGVCPYEIVKDWGEE